MIDIYHGDARCNARAVVRAASDEVLFRRVERAKRVLRKRHGRELQITRVWVGSNAIALYYVKPR